MTAVFIAPLGYGRFCRLLTIGSIRHVTACLASIAADEPVLVTAAMPPDADLCSACLADLQVRSSRSEDLAPYAIELGIRADLTVERAADEMFGPEEPVTSRTTTPDLRPVCKVDPVATWEEYGGTVIVRLEDVP